jgi:hypothetical protein
LPLALVAVAGGCSTTQPTHGSVPEALVATKADETSPAAAGGYLAWTVGSKDGPVIVMKLGRVYVRRGSGPASPVTSPGVLAASGGMDGRTLVVQLVRGGQSDLALVDLRTGRLRAPRRGVNTRLWEWRGSISGRRLLFGRLGLQRYDVVLEDLRTGREQILDSVQGHAPYAEPGQVNGRYAVWASCPDNACSIYRYDARTGARIRISSTYGSVVYAPSVAATGDVYYGHGPGPCGSEVKLMRYRSGRETVVLRLRTGYDFRFSSVARIAGRTRVLLDGGRCGRGFDVFEVDAGVG